MFQAYCILTFSKSIINCTVPATIKQRTKQKTTYTVALQRASLLCAALKTTQKNYIYSHSHSFILGNYIIIITMFIKLGP